MIVKKSFGMYKTVFYLIFGCFFLAACSSSKDDEEVAVFGNDLPVGASAEEFLLQQEEFPTIEIEVAYTENFQPLPESLQNLRDFVEQHTQKEVIISPNEIMLDTQESYTKTAIEAIEEQFRVSENEPEKISTFILFLPGSYAQNTADSIQLGLAYKNTSIALFEKDILNITNSKANQEKVESRLAAHHFTHLLGLVNQGVPMISNHEDPQFSKHCITENCLLQAATNFANNSDFLLSNDLQLKSYCLEDLAAFKNAN